MTIVLGVIYMLLFVAAFTTLAWGMDTGRRSVTRVGVVLVVLWGIWAVVH